MTESDQTQPTIASLDSTVAERIVTELRPAAGERILRSIRTAGSLLHHSSEDEEDLRYAESAAYNLREALDSVVRDRSAGEGGFAEAIDS
jgi:hypothetical protein